MRVVLDTNVLVSALLKRDSVPGRLFAAVRAGSLQLVLSEPLWVELREVLAYPKIRKRLESHAVDTALFLDLLRLFSITADLTGVEAPLPRDPDDQPVLATLVAAQADWLITGDKDLLALAGSFPILTPTVFVTRFLE